MLEVYYILILYLLVEVFMIWRS